MSYLSSAGVFLIQTIFGIYLIIVMLRFIMQLVRADFYNPLSQFIVKATTPPLKQLRRFIPGLMGIDMASVVLLISIKTMEIFLIGLLPGFPEMQPLGIFMLAIVGLLKLAVYIFIFSIVIMAIISWIAPGTYNPVAALVNQITEPVIRPFRRYIQPMAGLDLSPLVAIVVLWLVMILLISPLVGIACSMDLFSAAFCRAQLL